jgi:acyl-CoA reductase-like NAD-dependent aldehyde dehydrogenase
VESSDILVGRIADEFEEQFVKAAQAIRIADPTDPASQM